MKKEIWKDIKDYPNYQVSNLGRILNIISNKILKAHKNHQGYLQVRLYKNGKNKNCYIHRLVAEAFIPNPNHYKEINHKDENPSNSIVDNLEWCDRKYNINYGSHNERMASKKSKKVIQMDKDYLFFKGFDEHENAKDFLLEQVEILDEEDEFIDIEEIEIKKIEETSHLEFKEKINDLIKNQKKIINKLKRRSNVILLRPLY